MSTTNTVVVGAGVSGLTTALLLSKNAKNRVTIIAKHMPGDYDIEYCSPWAGADYSPFAKAGSTTALWEEQSWLPLSQLAEDRPESGVHFQKSISYNRNKDGETPTGQVFAAFSSSDPWFKNTVRDFRVLSPSELPPGVDSGTEFTTVQINVTIYLHYLLSQCIKNGVIVSRAVLSHIAEARNLHHTGRPADAIINCTGLSASTLGGVEDKTLSPARGQIVIVRNDPGVMACTSGTDDGEEELVYIQKRAAGGGTVLGGSYQLNNWESQPDPNLAIRIMKRAVELRPQLTGGKGIEALSVVRHAVGLRPCRLGGIRLEKELIDGAGWVVHNYGHAGYGYQVSYGCAEAVVKLIDEIPAVELRLP